MAPKTMAIWPHMVPACARYRACAREPGSEKNEAAQQPEKVGVRLASTVRSKMQTAALILGTYDGIAVDKTDSHQLSIQVFHLLRFRNFGRFDLEPEETMGTVRAERHERIRIPMGAWTERGRGIR